MSEVKWIKICTDIFDDDKILLIENMQKSDSILVIWFKLLCLAGKQNNSGVFTIQNGMPYTDKMFATAFRRKQSLVKLALKTFEELGMVEIINDIVVIPKWEKHQSLESFERVKENTRKRVAKHREKQRQIAESSFDMCNVTCNAKCNVTCNADVTVCNSNVTQTDKEVEEDKDIDIIAVADNNINNIYNMPGNKKTADNDSAATAVLRKYEQMIGLATPAVIEGIDFFVSEGMETDLIIRIIEYACEQGKRTWQYINAALMGNLNEDVKNLDAYNRTQAERAERKEHKTAPGKSNAQVKGNKSKFNNYTDTNKLTLTPDQIIADMLEESGENK